MKIIEKILWHTLTNKIKMTWANNKFVQGLRYMVTNKDFWDKIFIVVTIIINMFWFASLFGTLFIMAIDYGFFIYASKLGSILNKKD